MSRELGTFSVISLPSLAMPFMVTGQDTALAIKSTLPSYVEGTHPLFYFFLNGFGQQMLLLQIFHALFLCTF
jgi:hypothetical protein